MYHLLDYIEKDQNSKLKTIQASRYVFESGTTIKINAAREKLVQYLTIKFELDKFTASEEVTSFEANFKKPKTVEIPEELLSSLSKLRAAFSVRNMKECFLIDKDTYERSDIDLEFYQTTLNKKPREVFEEALYMDSVYNPRQMEAYYPTYIDGVPCMAINTYKYPHWMHNKAEAKIPELFKGLIDHLIANETAKVYFYDWLHKSLTDKAYTFLLLCGMKGIGKGQLQKLIRALHGRGNFVEGKRGTISGQFNGQLENTRLIWFDEIQYDKSEVNNLKGILNDDLSIEKKGVDSSRSTPIHCSIVLSNNDLTDNYIEIDDRRFSPLELTEKRLTESFNSSWFDEFNYHVDELGDKSPLVAEFGHWILEHGKHDIIERQEPYIGDKFNQIVISSLRRWQDNVLSIFENESELSSLLGQHGNFFTYDQLRTKYEMKFKESGSFPKKEKVLEFLRCHIDIETRKPIVEIVKEGRFYRVVPIELLEEYNSGFKEVGKIKNKLEGLV